MRSAALPLLLLAVAGAAQEVPAPQTAPPVAALRLTVDEAVARALAASPRLARLSALEAAAGAQARGARAERMPQLDLSASYLRHSEIPEFSGYSPTGDPLNPVEEVVIFPSIEDNWRLRAGVSVPVYTGGRINGQVTATEQGRVAAVQDLHAGRSDLVLETKNAYWSLVTARESERVYRDAIRAYDAHLADARARERVGMAARNEVLAVEVERDRAELDRLRAEVSAGVAEANLSRLLDAPPGTSLEPSEPLEATAAARPPLDRLVAQAQASRPERKALAARVLAADAAASAERGARLPQVGVSGGFVYANPNREIVPPSAQWDDTWELGIGVSWSVFDGGRRAANEARARAQSDATRAQLAEVDQGIRLEVTQRALELKTAESRLAVAERSVVSAAESRRVATERYRGGVIPSSELLDAELAHERAALTRTEALAALRLAAAGLDRAIGR